MANALSAIRSNGAIKNVLMGRQGLRTQAKEGWDATRRVSKEGRSINRDFRDAKRGHTKGSLAYTKAASDASAKIDDVAEREVENVGKLHSAMGNWATGGDYAGEGIKRAGVIGARGAAVAGGAFAIGGTARALTGTGTGFVNRDGERDIAGIPFI